MALKHSQQLKLSQKLLPQQILLMKLLQLPTLALEERIKEELEANPALEEENEQTQEEEQFESEAEQEEEYDENGDVQEKEHSNNDVEMEDYMDAEEMDSYKYEVVNKGKDDDSREFVVVEGPGFRELLEQQLGLRNLSNQEYIIGSYLIGCIDEDGYIRR